MATKKPRKDGLTDGIRRAFVNHRTPIGAAYRREYLATVARFPGLPATAAGWVREAALIALELARLAQDAALSRDRGLVRKPLALERHAVRLREQLMAIEAKLADLAKPAKLSIAELMAAARGGR